MLTHLTVTLFTCLLFLSGYALQQQTLRELQQTIRPRIPTRRDAASAAVQNSIAPSRLFAGSEGSKGRLAYQASLRASDDAAATVDWKKLAHVQLVRTHQEVCNAIMIFSDLAQHKSPARRVLLFPQDWAIESAAGSSEVGDPYLITSIRLLRMAARRYAVELRPITPVKKRRTEFEQDVYSLASAAALVDLDRVMSIEGPGTILDATRFDAMLAFTADAPFAMLEAGSNNSNVHQDDLLMLQPSTDMHTEVIRKIAANETYSDSMFSSVFADPLLMAASEDDNVLIRSVGQLHQAAEDFNGSAFMLTAAYIRFSDPKLPGPEWDVPYEQRREARPENQDADWLWTELYGQFAQKRADICGLGLEPWRP